MRVIIMSANAVFSDCNNKTQGALGGCEIMPCSSADFFDEPGCCAASRCCSALHPRLPSQRRAVTKGECGQAAPVLDLLHCEQIPLRQETVACPAYPSASLAQTSAFEGALEAYIRELRMPCGPTLHLVQLIRSCDFSAARGHLVASGVPAGCCCCCCRCCCCRCGCRGDSGRRGSSELLKGRCHVFIRLTSTLSAAWCLLLSLSLHLIDTPPRPCCPSCLPALALPCPPCSARQAQGR